MTAADSSASSSPAIVTAISRRESSYADAAVDVGIVHLGLGAFHRAHQAAYIEAWLERNGGGPWGICAANVRSNRKLVAALEAQDCRYHLAEYRDREQVRVGEIRAIRQALFGGDDPTAVLAAMTTAGTRIVTLSVSEKAYGLRPASGELDTTEPVIAADLAGGAPPRSIPGLLVEGLRRRRMAGHRPFTVLCCDNMPDNGRRTRIAVTEFARRRSPELAAWIEDEVAFPSSMVDRIVPAVDAPAQARLTALIGHQDPAAVACEAFSQWVVEDRFPLGRPDWEPEGVEMVADVAPWETMKLRLLNGAHSLLAYAGLARGFTTVAAAIGDDAIRQQLRRFWAETAPTLGPRPAGDPASYTKALLERFGNDALEHRLNQIAMDGSQKIPQRWLAAAQNSIEHGRPIGETAAAVAAWLAYVRGEDSAGRRWTVDDPMAARLADCHRQASADEVVAAALALDAVFPPRLSGHPAFRRAVAAAWRDHNAGDGNARAADAL